MYLLKGRCVVKYDSESNLVEDFGRRDVSSFILHPAYPNPFNASRTFSFELGVAGKVSLDIFDITGRNVGVLHATPGNALPQNQYLLVGYHSVTFNAEGLTSGIYFLRLEALSGAGTLRHTLRQTQKLLLLK